MFPNFWWLLLAVMVSLGTSTLVAWRKSVRDIANLPIDRKDWPIYLSRANESAAGIIIRIFTIAIVLTAWHKTFDGAAFDLLGLFLTLVVFSLQVSLEAWHKLALWRKVHGPGWNRLRNWWIALVFGLYQFVVLIASLLVAFVVRLIIGPGSSEAIDAWVMVGAMIAFMLLPFEVTTLLGRAAPASPDLLELLREHGWNEPQIPLIVRDTHGANIANAFAVQSVWSRGRIEVFDTLVNRMSPDQLVGILFHEKSHLRHRDNLVRLALMAMAWLLAVGVLHVLGEARASSAWLAMLLAPALLMLGMSQRQERRADRDAAEWCGDATVYGSALIKLHEINYTPNDWAPEDRDGKTHPSLIQRLAEIGVEDQAFAEPDSTPPVKIGPTLALMCFYSLITIISGGLYALNVHQGNHSIVLLFITLFMMFMTAKQVHKLVIIRRNRPAPACLAEANPPMPEEIQDCSTK